MFSHHSRGLSGHLYGVSSVGDWHVRPVHDVQTGIQDSIVKLEKKKNTSQNLFLKVWLQVLDLSFYHLSIVPVSLCDVAVCTVVDDPHFSHHTLVPLSLIIQKHGII